MGGRGHRPQCTHHGGASVTIVTVDLVAVGADHVEVPVVEDQGPGLALHGAELLQEVASGAVVHKHAVGALAGNVKVVIQAEGKTPWPVEATTAWLHEDIKEGTSVGVVAKHTAGLEVGHKHGREEGEGGASDCLIGTA